MAFYRAQNFKGTEVDGHGFGLAKTCQDGVLLRATWHIASKLHGQEFPAARPVNLRIDTENIMHALAIHVSAMEVWEKVEGDISRRMFDATFGGRPP